MRIAVCCVSSVLWGSQLAAQAPAMPPHELVSGGLPMPGVVSRSSRGTPVLPPRQARIRSNDGRVLITRAGLRAPLAWLVDTARTLSDSSFSAEFTVSFVAASTILISSQGQCLTITPNESTIPLSFGSCESEPLWIYPAADSAIASGEAGFWLISRMGMVGPGVISPLLMPRSNLRVWFRLEPIK